MAKQPTPRQRIEDLLDRFGEEIRQAFIASIQDIRDTARIAAIAQALEKGDVERALELVGVDPVAFRGLQRAIRTTFEETGALIIRDIPTLRDAENVQILLRFDPGNPSAARWIEKRGAELVTAIVEDQRNAIRAALAAGLAEGRGPRDVALDLVGRINKASGVRQGGIVGLTSGQAEAARAARGQLGSADPAELRAYLGRQARDRRFDASVITAIGDKSALPADTVDRAVNQYENRLLALRGETIGRTEAAQAVGASNREAFEQMLQKTGIDRGLVTKVWRAHHDQRTRDSHRILDGQSMGFDKPFQSPTGAQLMFPGDTSLGAGPQDVIACRCIVLNRITRPAAR